MDIKKPRNYWTKELCQKEAKLYTKRSDFRKFSKGAYEYARINNLLNEICSHMKIYYQVDIWTKEKCIEVIDDCEFLSDFYTNYNTAYQSCVRNNWLNELTINLKRNYKPSGYWNKQQCIDVALTCKNKLEFKTIYSSAYSSAIDNKWLSEIYDICNFNNKNNGIWTVYSYIISNKYVYVGITTNENRRKWEHLTDTRSSVYKFITDNNINIDDIVYKIEEKNIIDLDIIKKLETEYLIHYINLGYVKINKHKTGSLGGGNIPYFTKEYCLDIAKTCKTKTEFKKYHSVYNYSKKYNWLDDMYSHMEIIKQPNGYWNDKQRCSDIAKTCKTKTEFKKYYTAYLYSKKNNWLDEICSHMEIIKHPNGYWNNKEICFEESLNYKNKQEFKTYRRSAYNYSYTNGWLNEFFPK